MDDSCRGTADEFIQKDNMYEPRNLTQVIQAVLNSIDPETNAWTRSNPTRNVSKVMVDISRDEMEIRQYMTNLKGISLAEKFPEIASEWHPTLNGTVTPSKVKPMSDVKYYWLCPECGNEYRSSVGHRVYGTGCPKCAIKNNALAKSKAIVMIDQNTGEVLKEFISISEASRQTGVSSSNITSACKGNRRIAGGYIWRYSNSILP